MNNHLHCFSIIDSAIEITSFLFFAVIILSVFFVFLDFIVVIVIVLLWQLLYVTSFCF